MFRKYTNDNNNNKSSFKYLLSILLLMLKKYQGLKKLFIASYNYEKNNEYIFFHLSLKFNSINIYILSNFKMLISAIEKNV